MVATSDIVKTIVIIIIFVLLYLFNILTIGIKKIQEDWPLYRCNPAVMPFASVFGHDAAENFTYCIQNMQSNYMGYLLQPVNYNLNVMGNIGTKLTSSLNDMRAFISNLRGYVTNIIQSVFSVFLNILIEMQRLTINIKDLFNKFIGIMVTLMYTLDGSIMTMNSTWSGPPGQLTRALCFHPATKIRLKDNSFVAMNALPLNAVLKNGAIVSAVMHISNVDEHGKCIEPLYKLTGGEQAEPILVSGSHLVYEPTIKRFIPVEQLAAAQKTELLCDTFTCLITSNHTIPIGQWIFHDWEDNNGSLSKSI